MTAPAHRRQRGPWTPSDVIGAGQVFELRAAWWRAPPPPSSTSIVTRLGVNICPRYMTFGRLLVRLKVHISDVMSYARVANKPILVSSATDMELLGLQAQCSQDRGYLASKWTVQSGMGDFISISCFYRRQA